MLFKKQILAIATLSSLIGCGGEDLDNTDTTPAVASINQYEKVNEPEIGESIFSIDVSLNKKALKDGSIDYSFTSNSATLNDDYKATAGTIEILEGERDFTIDVIILADDNIEDDEVFIVELSNPKNLTISDETSTVTIEDKTPSLAVVSINQYDSIQEPENGDFSHSIDIRLNKQALKEGSIDYSITPSTATQDKDFIPKNGTIEVLKGVRELSIDVVILADDIDEDDEVFIVELSNPVNLTLSENISTITIEDTDPTPSISFSVQQGTVKEVDGDYRVSLNLSNDSERGVEIPFILSGLSTPNSDFTLLTENPIILETGVTSVDILFNISNDSIPEGGESIIITLSEPLNATLSDKSVSSIIILGDLALTDTGVTTFFDGENYTSTEVSSDYPNQDASYGLDRGNISDTDGFAGFSYTKIDRSGNALPSNATAYEDSDGDGFRCIRDEVTGLTWETKMTQPQTLPQLFGDELKAHITNELSIAAGDDELSFIYTPAQKQWQNKDYTYTWFDTNEAKNGLNKGTEGETLPNNKYPINSQCAFPNKEMSNYTAINSCSTDTYIEVANTLSTCGFDDWHLPSVEELRSIHNYKTEPTSNPANEYFQDKVSGDYFTDSSGVENSGSVWCMNADSGEMKFCNKQIPNHIRLVRGDSK